MYRYYQTTEKGSWHPIADNPIFGAASKTYTEALTKGAKKLTILSVSEVVDDYTDKDSLSYRGPLYFDIDCKEDLYQAIVSARELVAKLITRHVPKEHILVYCSGSKGMHILVDPRMFSSNKPTRALPHIYKMMARELYVFGLDYQVYCGGRGNSWRLVNQQRADGHYRVTISHAELESLTPDIYNEYVKAPRAQIFFPEKLGTTTAPGLATLFDRCKEAIKRELREKTKSTVKILSDELLVEIKKEVPGCVKDLTDGKLNASVNFNEAAFQLAIYLASTETDPHTCRTLCGALAENSSSSQYGTSKARLQHALGLVGYCKTGYKFSCSAIRRVISTNPCKPCPVELQRSPLEKEVDKGGVGIVEHEDGYYAVGTEGERRISTFTMEILDYHAELQQDGTFERTTGFKALVKSPGLNCKGSAEIYLSEDMWSGRSALIRELSGLGSLAFLGNDVDVQRIKNFLVEQYSGTAGSITTVYTAGMVTQKIGSSEIMVYVEPQGSINQMKVRNTHYLNADITCPAQLLESSMPMPGDTHVREALTAVTEMNTAHNMAILLGWHVASHFKYHMVKAFNQFPILSIWGSAGAGKTQTAVQLCWLNGCDYTAEHSPINVSEASEWSLIDFCSSSTTVPRILDEANQTKMIKHKYFKFAEVVKSAWGNQSVTRGTIRKTGGAVKGRTGARMINIPISAPLIIISEQAQDMAAIQQRSLSVFLTKEARDTKTCYEAFAKVTRNRKYLKQLGKALMIHALTTSIESVAALVEKHLATIPTEYDDRPRFSFAVVLAGLDLLIQTCEGLNLEMTEKLQSLQGMLIKFIHTNIAEVQLEKARTEVDAVIQDLGMMAALTQTGMGKELMEGSHYVVNGTDLILDYILAFPLYQLHCAKNRKQVIINNVNQFKLLIRQEPYYRGESRVAGFSERNAMVLDCRELAKKGIDVSMFDPLLGSRI